ncbi:hypothetical protein ACFLSE_06630 [Bacteroidota bacterium]
MIQAVHVNSKEIRSGEVIELNIQAEYPITIEVKCFVTKPPPPRYIPCPDAGTFTLNRQEAFLYSATERIFKEGKGHIEFEITDADNDFKLIKINVEDFDILEKNEMYH